MREQYHSILKKTFYTSLIHTRVSLELTQAQMADKLAMDERSYIDLDHGKTCCSAVTLALYLVYCCEAPMEFIEQLRQAFEAGVDRVA